MISRLSRFAARHWLAQSAASGGKWLLGRDAVSDYVLAKLIETLFNRTMSLLTGAMVVWFVAIAAFSRTGHIWPLCWIAFDVATVLARVWIVKRHGNRRLQAPSIVQRHAFAIMTFGLLWAAALGAGCFMCLRTRDPVLALLSSVVVTGITGALAFRNGGVPRYAMIQMSLCEIPLGLGMLAQADPWTWLLALKSPFYILGLFNIVRDHARTMATTIIAEHETKAVAARLDAALVNMPVGLMMFEANDGLQVWNGRVAELLQIEPATIVRGSKLKSLLQLAAVCPTPESNLDVDELVQQLEGNGNEAQFLMADGKALLFMGRNNPGGLFSVMVKDITERRLAEAHFAHLAQHDALTGLSNRYEFNERLTALCGRETESPFTLLFVDLDQFKGVNDTHGHQAGDRLLCAVADRLSQLVPSGSTVARLGGDEFAIILPFNRVGAAVLAERLIEVIARPCELGSGCHVFVGASIGVAQGPEEGVTAELLQLRADCALYAAKAAGRGTVRIFDGAFDWCDLEAESREHTIFRSAIR